MAQRFSKPALSWMLGLTVTAAFAVSSVLAQSESGEKIYQKTVKGTVWIITRRGGNRIATGTGSLIDRAHRLVVTNYHVVGEADRAYVFFPVFRKGKPVAERSEYWELLKDGAAINGEVIAREPKKDLALIRLERVPPDAQPILLAAEGASAGQRVHSIGNPGLSGALWGYTPGTVRQSYHKKWQAKEGDTVHHFEADVVETQSPTNQGDSGGPLVNDYGELVAVTQGYASGAQLLSLFIDVKEVKTVVPNKYLAKITAPRRHTAGDRDKVATESSADQVLAGGEKQEKLASTKLSFAKTLAADGKLEKAKDRYEEIISAFPSTKAAAEAKLLLDKLSK